MNNWYMDPQSVKCCCRFWCILVL